MIDNDMRAVKPSCAIGSLDSVLLRETTGAINVQIHYEPQTALEVGRALIETALDMGATP